MTKVSKTGSGSHQALLQRPVTSRERTVRSFGLLPQNFFQARKQLIQKINLAAAHLRENEPVALQIPQYHFGRAKRLGLEQSRALSDELCKCLGVPKEEREGIRVLINHGTPEEDLEVKPYDFDVEVVSGRFFRVGHLFFLDVKTYQGLAGEKQLLEKLDSNVALCDLGRINNGEDSGITTFAVIMKMISLDADPSISTLDPAETLFLDCGAGKGFLSLAAYKLWGIPSLLVEISEAERSAALVNLGYNHLEAERDFIFPESRFGITDQRAIAHEVPPGIRNLVVGSNMMPASVPQRCKDLYGGINNGHAEELAERICELRPEIRVAAGVYLGISEDYWWCPEGEPYLEGRSWGYYANGYLPDLTSKDPLPVYARESHERTVSDSFIDRKDRTEISSVVDRMLTSVLPLIGRLPTEELWQMIDSHYVYRTSKISAFTRLTGFLADPSMVEDAEGLLLWESAKVLAEGIARLKAQKTSGYVRLHFDEQGRLEDGNSGEIMGHCSDFPQLEIAGRELGLNVWNTFRAAVGKRADSITIFALRSRGSIRTSLLNILFPKQETDYQENEEDDGWF